MKTGDEVRGIFGAMIPELIGKVEVTKCTDTGLPREVLVRWEDGSDTWLTEDELRDDYFTPALPAIGYFLYKEND